MANGAKKAVGTTKTMDATYATLADVQTLRREVAEDVNTLRSDLVVMTRELSNQIQNRQQFDSKFHREISEKIAANHRTNWGTVIAAGSLLAFIAALAGALVSSTLNAERSERLMATHYLEEAIEEVEERSAKRHETAKEIAAKFDDRIETRISDNVAVMVERIIAIERSVFGDGPNYRDIDRK